MTFYTNLFLGIDCDILYYTNMTWTEQGNTSRYAKMDVTNYPVVFHHACGQKILGNVA